MKKFRLRRTEKAGDKYGTGEWEVSPWWSAYFPFVYKSRSFYFSHQRRELPMTPYRVRKNGKMVVSPSMEAEYWNGWLVALWRAIGSLVEKTMAKIKSLKQLATQQEDIPF